MSRVTNSSLRLRTKAASDARESGVVVTETVAAMKQIAGKITIIGEIAKLSGSSVQVAEMAEELSNQAEHLRSAMEYFKVDDAAPEKGRG